MCLILAQCKKGCDRGETLSLTDFCKCVPQAEVRALFPESASREDVAQSIRDGIEAAKSADTDDINFDTTTLGKESEDEDEE